MIHVIDYGVGNVQAFLNVYKRLGLSARRATRPDDLASATHVILPGVGSFDRAMLQFKASGFHTVLSELVCSQSAHVMGVCVGRQMLAQGSDEGDEAGLGLVEGRVKPIRQLVGPDIPTPHMGWNTIKPTPGHLLFEGIEAPQFYFLHSYYFKNVDPASAIARVDYGREFTCAVSKGKVFGVQFHPEKSHHYGQQLLGNFARL